MRKLGYLICFTALVAIFAWVARAQVRDVWTRAKAVPAWVVEPRSPVRFLPNETVLKPRHWNGSRVYLFAGIFNGADMWRSDFYRPTVDQLLAGGAEVVLMDNPRTRARWFDDHGAGYCKAMVEWIDSTDRRLDRDRPARRKVLFGASFGGYQALMGAARLGWVDGYVALSPMTRLEVLGEFWFTDNAACNPFNEVPALRKKPGYIAYGTADRRVNGGYVAELAARLQIKPTIYPGRGHVDVGDEYPPAARFALSIT